MHIHISQARENMLCICKLQQIYFSCEKVTERLHECSRFTLRLRKYWVLIDSSGRKLGIPKLSEEKNQ